MIQLLSGQEPKVTQIAGVDDTKMGAYRALARLSFEAPQKGDVTTALTLALILERSWGKAEGGNEGKGAILNNNEPLFREIDNAMDQFIKPMMDYSVEAPDPENVKAKFDDYLAKLKQNDSPQ